MKRPIAISLSPNTDRADVMRAITTLASFLFHTDHDILSTVARMISKRFEGRFVILTTSGRQALYDILTVLNIGKGDEVIMQAFTCIAVAEPVLWVGAKPIYADVAEGVYTIDPADVEKKITPKTKAIIVQHTFGIPAPIEEIMRIAKQHNVPVIEDCAHAYGVLYNEKSLGTFADIAFFSFGRDKSLSSVYGGACVVKSRAHMERLRAIANKRKHAPLSWTAQQLLHPIIFSMAVPLYFVGGIGKALIVLCQKLGLLSKAVEAIEKQGRKPTHISYQYPAPLASLLYLQLKKIDAMNARRQEIAQQYHDAFGGPNGALLRFPMLVQNPGQLHMVARDQHMLLGDWYNAVLVPATSNFAAFRYEFHSCPRAEALAASTINLPTYPSLSDTQVADVIRFIKKYAS